MWEKFINSLIQNYQFGSAVSFSSKDEDVLFVSDEDCKQNEVELLKAPGDANGD